MADADKAAKLAAAKKKVAEMKKKQQKSKAGSSKKEETKKDDKPEEKADVKEEAPAKPPTPEPETSPAPAVVSDEKPAGPAPEEEENDDVAPLSPAKESAPSLAQQSRARSASFRKPSISGSTTPGMFSPEGETAPDIYRKHVARIEELEKENKRLAKEASDAETRWQKAESQLADLRDDDTSGKTDIETEKLRNDVAALKRQNDQLQAQLAAKAGGGGARHGSSPSISVHPPPAVTELEAQLTSKSATIETMELEMSRLRAQVERLSLSASSPSEQISALEEKLARAEKAAALAQRELGDLKKNLDRTAEKAVKAGSGLASAETKIRSLEKEVEEVKTERDELVKKVDGLEKKVSTLTTLHKEQDGRMQAVRKEKEARDKEVAELKSKLEKLEAENVKLRKEHAADGGGDDEGVDELENEGRVRLEKRIRDLEAENTDLRRGIWHEKRKELQVGPDDVGGKFTDVDLGNGESHHNRRKSTAGGGIGDFFTSGLNALAGVSGGNHHGEDEGFLEDDEDMEFDEEAFRKAHEEEAKNRLERIREIKRGLKNWEGWRLDLVENRRGGGEGIGEIFEV
ncbi:hypothetical protein DL546_007212 [Coniochaeta pulveracea]|uniref:M protein repeat protein n=1 Tax=Coniochaeta pulveracea TaxID=177199 RepID=A0A420YFC0_9PEZI|nr:hypothetical protein DL546_007212 [Coniochaeta pulveracea]